MKQLGLFDQPLTQEVTPPAFSSSTFDDLVKMYEAMKAFRVAHEQWREFYFFERFTVRKESLVQTFDETLYTDIMGNAFFNKSKGFNHASLVKDFHAPCFYNFDKFINALGELLERYQYEWADIKLFDISVTAWSLALLTPCVPDSVLGVLVNSPNEQLRGYVAHYANLPLDIFEYLANEPCDYTLRYVVTNPNAPLHVLEYIAQRIAGNQYDKLKLTTIAFWWLISAFPNDYPTIVNILENGINDHAIFHMKMIKGEL